MSNGYQISFHGVSERGAAIPSRPRRGMWSTYDAATDGEPNRAHWRNADGYSATAANSLPVRRKLRHRSRYERANSPYYDGMVRTVANDLIGTGPRPQVLTSDAAANADIEQKFATWGRVTGFNLTLLVMAEAKTVEGEPFGIMVSENVDPEERGAASGFEDQTPVTLRLVETECDRVTDPNLEVANRDRVLDGIEYDDLGRPVLYHILDSHPSDVYAGIGEFGAYHTYPASQVIHWFRKSRIGQRRGIPEITSSLSLFALFRRYTLAVTVNAESSADVFMTLETQAPPSEIDEGNEFERLALAPGQLMTMPAGYTAKGYKPEQPTTTYREFKGELLNECARPINMPKNVAAANSAEYNYSSGRLDFQLYHKAIDVERSGCEQMVLERVFAMWLYEASRIPGFLPALPEGYSYAALPHRWFWDGFPHVDPEKEANALQTLLACNATTLSDHYASQGHDWEAKMRQRAREVALERELGIEQVQPAPRPSQPPQQDSGDGQSNRNAIAIRGAA